MTVFTTTSTTHRTRLNYSLLAEAIKRILDVFPSDSGAQTTKQKWLDLAGVFLNEAQAANRSVVDHPHRYSDHAYQICVATLRKMGKLKAVDALLNGHKAEETKKIITNYKRKLASINHLATEDILDLKAFFKTLHDVEQKRQRDFNRGGK